MRAEAKLLGRQIHRGLDRQQAHISRFYGHIAFTETFGNQSKRDA